MASYKGKPKDLQQLVSKVWTAGKEGRTAEAEKLLRQIVQLEPDDENRAVVAQACLNLGELCDRRNGSAEALRLYGKARDLGATLSARAWSVLAESYADRQATTDDAVNAYMVYIERRDLDASTAKVYAALEMACRVDEDEIAADRARAFELNKRVIAANGGLEWPHYYLGVAYLQQGDLPAAMMNLTRARKRNPNRPMTCYWMGACHLRQSGVGLPAAMEWLSKFLAFPPENLRIAELQGTAGFELGKRLMRIAAPGQAIPFLRMAIARGAENAPEHLLLGQAYFETGQLDLSFEALTRACVIDPDSGEARELLAQVCLSGARYEDAETHSRAALRLQGPEPAIVGCLMTALYRQDKLTGLVGLWEQADPAEASPETVFRVALSYARLGKFEPALACLERLPREPRVVYYSGCALANLGRIEEARAAWETLTAGRDEYATKALVELGTLSLQAGDVGGAGDCYDRALERDAHDTGALYGMGSLAFRMDEMEVASDCFSKVLEARPDDARAQLAMASVCESRGDVAAAVRHYEAASEKFDVRIALGVLYCRTGRYAESAGLLAPLFQSGAESDAVSYYLGMTLSFLHRRKEAAEVWKKLQARHPEDRDIAAGLADLCLGQALEQWTHAAAEGLLDQALNHDPLSVRWRFFRTLYDWKSAKPADVSERLRELAEPCEHDAPMLHGAGLRLLLDGEPDQALQYLEHVARQRESGRSRFASQTPGHLQESPGQYAQPEAALSASR